MESDEGEVHDLDRTSPELELDDDTSDDEEYTNTQSEDKSEAIESAVDESQNPTSVLLPLVPWFPINISRSPSNIVIGIAGINDSSFYRSSRVKSCSQHIVTTSRSRYLLQPKDVLTHSKTIQSSYGFNLALPTSSSQTLFLVTLRRDSLKHGCQVYPRFVQHSLFPSMLPIHHFFPPLLNQ
ncbi:hypothetical protein GEMRC1_013969 [Eukaryota sp. GEM-RC1]